jgi:hypothetical protein
MTPQKKQDDDLRKQAWQYFHMHAAQRLTTFNYYVVMSSVITTGIFAASLKDYPIVGGTLLLGIVLILLSITFWKLDKRNRELIKNAEAALKFFESCSELEDAGGEPHPAKLFSREERVTASKRANLSFFTLRRHFTYADCFRLVFLIFGLCGLAGMVFGVVRLVALWRSV